MAKSKESLSTVARQLVDGIEAGESLPNVGEKVARKAVELIIDDDQELQESLNYIRDSLTDATEYFISSEQAHYALKVVMLSRAIYATFETMVPILAVARHFASMGRLTDPEAKEKAKKVTDDILTKLTKTGNGL